MKYPIVEENDQSTLLFKKHIRRYMYRQSINASMHYSVEMYITDIKIILFMHHMKKNIEHVPYHLQTY